MLISFKSKASAEITMYKSHIVPILETLGKSIERGVITAAETSGVISTLESMIEKDRKERLAVEIEDDDDLDDVEKKKKNDIVTLSARLYPLMEMLKAANLQQVDVLWGV